MLQTQIKPCVYSHPVSLGTGRQRDTSTAAASYRSKPYVSVCKKSPAIEGKKGGRICRISALQAQTPKAAKVFASVSLCTFAVFGKAA